MSDQPLATCPKEICPQKRWGKGKVKKLISSGAGLIFKGSGFYITDYRSEGYKAAAKKESGAASTDAGKTDKAAAGSESKAGKPAATAESKPAAKSEAKPAKAAKAKE